MWSGADLNGEKLRICRAYLRISDHCRVTVRVRAGLGLGIWLGLVLGLALGFGLRIVVYKLLEKVTECGSIT